MTAVMIHQFGIVAYTMTILSWQLNGTRWLFGVLYSVVVVEISIPTMMKPLLQFSAGVFLGILVMQYLPSYHHDQDNASQESISKSSRMKFSQNMQVSQEDVIEGIPAPDLLKNFNDGMKSDFLSGRFNTVTDGVYVARAFAAGNVIILEGPEGLVIVDTTESLEAAEIIRKELRTITSKPIKAIVLTHSHPDHTNGIQAFVDDKSNPPDVWAFHTFKESVRIFKVIGPKAMRGSVYQFGLMLGEERMYPILPYGLGLVKMDIWPNKLVKNEVEQVQIAGINITFMHVPGETDDHLAVWLPDSRVLLTGDNILSYFPNVYAIRSTPLRDPIVWADSLRQMRSLHAEHLVPSHTDHTSGRKEIYDLFTVYSSAILFIHDQTVRHLNEFKHPDEIGRSLKLPSTLASHPYLAEFYGMVEWTSKVVYTKFVGWFSGDPVELLPLTPLERSQAYVKLIGVDRILDEVESALRSGDSQWALELSSHVHRVQPENLHAKWLRLQALRDRAAQQVNPLARNYYLTSALDSYQFINWKGKPGSIDDSISFVLKLMKYRVKAELTDGANSTVRLHFSDTKTTFQLQVLHSVLDIDELSSDDESQVPADVPRIKTTEIVWLNVLLGQMPAATAFSTGQLTVDGSLTDVRTFLSYF